MVPGMRAYPRPWLGPIQGPELPWVGGSLPRVLPSVCVARAPEEGAIGHFLFSG